MLEKHICEQILGRLKKYGAFKWHRSKNHSFYIKFRDVRLGSIRISNHGGRQRYNYAYELYRQDVNIQRSIDRVVRSIKQRATKLRGFDPKKFVVYSTSRCRYIQVKDKQEYKDYILKKKT